VTVAWPGVTVLALVVMFAVYAFLSAGLHAALAFGSRTAKPVFAHLLLGLIDLAAGVMALAWPGATALVLVLLVASWAILTGVIEIVTGFRSGEAAGTRAMFTPKRPAVGGLRRRALHQPRHGRDLARAAVRPVQPRLGHVDADQQHRAALGEREAPVIAHAGQA
jgi:Short repeat of unknown function (DUF308)